MRPAAWSTALFFAIFALLNLSATTSAWAQSAASPNAPLEPLCRACKTGKIAEVQQLLSTVGNLNGDCGGFFTGVSPLCVAAGRLDLNILSALLSRGADPNFAPAANELPTRSPLAHAASGSPAAFPLKRPIVECLLAAGADVNLGDATGYTPLMSAAYSGDLEMILLLVKSGAEINAATRYKKDTALSFARKNGHLEVVRALLDLGAK
jgi:ankyrin repeat protein